MSNLLSQPIISINFAGQFTLPGVLAALARDEVDGFPALRPHQEPSWHMFLVQLAVLALHGAGRRNIPETEEAWLALLRGLTPDFPGDEPWCLVVDDGSKPAFLQPAVPEGVKLANDVETADALDLLITSRNHDLKQTIARAGTAEDWVFALVSLQTGEGYGGAGNQGIARMNGGSSSRAMLTLAPLASAGGKQMTVRPGAWFRRDVRILLETRETVLENTALDYDDNGLGLTWLAPWAEGEQLRIGDLDLWFIEVCRRVRLLERSGRIVAVKGTSKETRIDAKPLKGNLDDPWAPVHKVEGKSFTLGDEGDFHYRTLTELLFSGNWVLPLLARRASFEGRETPLAIVTQALARGNSKTGGFRSRIVPLDSRNATLNWNAGAQERLRAIAQDQIKTIDRFDKALSYALVLATAAGDRERINREAYAFTRQARGHLDRFADTIFFTHLWQRFEAETTDADTKAAIPFAACLWQRTQAIFEQFLPDMPCHLLYRHRAEVRARRALRSKDLRDNYPELFASDRTGEVREDA